MTRSTSFTAVRLSVTISQPLITLTERVHRSRPPRLLQVEYGCLERGACSLWFIRTCTQRRMYIYIYICMYPSIYIRSIDLSIYPSMYVSSLIYRVVSCKPVGTFTHWTTISAHGGPVGEGPYWLTTKQEFKSHGGRS